MDEDDVDEEELDDCELYDDEELDMEDLLDADDFELLEELYRGDGCTRSQYPSMHVVPSQQGPLNQPHAMPSSLHSGSGSGAGGGGGVGVLPDQQNPPTHKPEQQEAPDVQRWASARQAGVPVRGWQRPLSQLSCLAGSA